MTLAKIGDIKLRKTDNLIQPVLELNEKLLVLNFVVLQPYFEIKDK